ncbi:hypothetical protein [Synechocystis sp. LKSZ1]|uniref:hypothetical protein n=1 Tax=Synechocystis sp. LKSZ1 TaxID=3144951 RepID=UPI00336BF69B
MLTDWIPFAIPISTVMIAGSCLWSLGLYLALVSWKNWLIAQLQRWFNFAERSLYTSEAEFERTRPAREAQNLFYASLVSILPFLVFGSLCNWAVEWGLGSSWSISTGLLASMIGAVYALGRQNSHQQN